MDCLIAKKLFDQLTAEETIILNEWLNKNPQNEEKLTDSISASFLINSCENFKNINVDNSWNTFKSKIDNLETPKEIKTYSLLNYLTFKTARIAAVLFVLIGVCFVFEFVSRTQKNVNISNFEFVNVDNDHERIEIVTNDELDVVVLPDQSLIYLNKNSKLIYDEKFNQNQRLVYLEGECFFKVAKDNKRPFIVYTAHTKTKVVGTSFNIKAYSSDETTELTVYSGKVRFSKLGEYEGDMIYLEKSDNVLFRNNTHLVKKSVVNYNESQLAWIKDGYMENYIYENEIEEKILSKSSNKNVGLNTLKEIPSPNEIIKDNEKSNPLAYLSNTTKWSNILFWEGQLSKITRIDGVVFNSAVYSSYQNFVFRATLYDGDDQVIGREEFNVNKLVIPGEKISYKKQLVLWDSKTEKVLVELISAHLIEK